MADTMEVRFEFELGAFVRLVGMDTGKWRVVERRVSQLLDEYAVGPYTAIVYACRDVEYSG